MVSNFGFGLFAKTVALFLFGPPPPQTKILQKEKVLVLMWTESLFTVYQALDWECFSDAEETFSHLSGPVRKNIWRICRENEYVCWIRQLLDTQNRVMSLPGEQQNRFMKIIYRYLGKRLDLTYVTDGIPRECFVPAGKGTRSQNPVKLHMRRHALHKNIHALWTCSLVFWLQLSTAVVLVSLCQLSRSWELNW